MNESNPNDPQGGDPTSPGDVMWTENLGGTIKYGPTIHSAYAYVVDDSGTAHYRHKRSVLGGKVDIGGSFTGPPVVVGDYFIIATTEEIVCYDKHLSEKRWETKIDKTVETGVSVAGGRVFVGLENGTVRAVEAATGRKLWNSELANNISDNLIVYKGELLVTADGNLFAMDPSTGDINWEFAPDVVLKSVPAPQNEKLFFAIEDGGVYSADYSQMVYESFPIANASYSVENAEDDWRITQKDKNTTSDGYGGVDDPVYNMTAPTAIKDKQYMRGSVAVNTEDGHLFVVHGSGDGNRADFHDATSEIIPEVGGGSVYYPSDGKLEVNPYNDDGDEFTVDKKVTTSLTISESHLFFGSGSKLVKVYIGHVEPPATATYYGLSGHNQNWKYNGQSIEPLNGETEDAINRTETEPTEEGVETVNQSNSTQTANSTNSTASGNSTGGNNSTATGGGQTNSSGNNTSEAASEGGNTVSSTSENAGSSGESTQDAVPGSERAIPESTGGGMIIATGKVILAGIGSGVSVLAATFGIAKKPD